MKKLFALILVLVLSLTGVAAVAESSTAYMIGLIDPVVSMNGQTFLDMTGLAIEALACVTDSGLTGLQLNGFAGQNYENTLLAAKAQLDANGLTFTADGLPAVYSVDVTELTEGINPYFILSMIPLNTTLRTPVEAAPVETFTAVDRMMGVAQLVMPYVTSSVTEGNSMRSEFALTREQGAQLILDLCSAIDSAAAATGENPELYASARELELAFELNGTVVTTGNPTTGAADFQLDASGLFSANDGSSLPFTLNYSDNLSNAVLTANFMPTDYPEEISVLRLSTASTPVSDGRERTQFDLSLTSDNETLTVNFLAAPVENTPRVDYSLRFTMPDDQGVMELAVSTGTNGSDIGFNIDFSLSMPYEPVYAFHLYYTGASSSDATGNTIVGNLDIGGSADGESVGLKTQLLLKDTLTDSSSWAYNSAGAINVDYMSYEDEDALANSLMNLLTNAVTVMQTNVPGIAPMLDMLTESMF